jgi:hypothetical protein
MISTLVICVAIACIVLLLATTPRKPPPPNSGPPLLPPDPNPAPIPRAPLIPALPAEKKAQVPTPDWRRVAFDSLLHLDSALDAARISDDERRKLIDQQFGSLIFRTRNEEVAP